MTGKDLTQFAGAAPAAHATHEVVSERPAHPMPARVGRTHWPTPAPNNPDLECIPDNYELAAGLDHAEPRSGPRSGQPGRKWNLLNNSLSEAAPAQGQWTWASLGGLARLLFTVDPDREWIRQRARQAFLDDFGSVECGRLEDEFGEDSSVFAHIRHFARNVYLSNTQRALKHRRRIIMRAHGMRFGLLAVFAVMWAALLFGTAIVSMPLVTLGALVFALAIYFLFAFSAGRLDRIRYAYRVATALPNIVRQSASVLDRNLGELTTQLNDAAHHYASDIGRLDPARLQDHANRALEKLEKLLRIDRRKRAHRDYYRAQVQLLIKARARELLSDRMWRFERARSSVWLAVAAALAAALIMSFATMGWFGGPGLVSWFLSGLAAAAALFFLADWSFTEAIAQHTVNVDEAVAVALDHGAWTRAGGKEHDVEALILEALVGSSTSAVANTLVLRRKEPDAPAEHEGHHH